MDPSEYYNTLLDLIRSLLDGNIESGTYEDQLREMFGIHAYMAFTLDKVVSNTVRQVRQSNKVFSMFLSNDKFFL